MEVKHTTTYAAIAPTLPHLSTAGKSAFLTGGGARGIGGAIASSLVRSGIASIGLLGRQEAKLRETEATLRALSPTVAVHVYAGVDVRDFAAVKAAVEDFAAVAKGTTPGKIDILLANAGYMPVEMRSLQDYATDADRADWWSSFEINILGNLHVVQAFLPVAAPQGAIVHTASLVADMPYIPKNGSYAAAKTAAQKLFEYVHHENPDLFVAQIHPGLVLTTDMATRSFKDAPYPGIDVALAGDFVVWLLSPEARFLNGRYVDVQWDIKDILAQKTALEKDPRKFTLGITGLDSVRVPSDTAAMAPTHHFQPLPPPRTPYSQYGDFRLPSASSSESGRSPHNHRRYDENAIDDDDDDDEDDDDFDLPFPAALARKDFLAAEFDPTAYLSSLFPSDGVDADGTDSTATAAQRHQTLEDLRAELRERSSAISAELLELVNANYTEFLGLGDALRGGDDKVEDVRVALFGFRRTVEDVQARVRARRVAVAAASDELAGVRGAVHAGRQLLALDARVAQLEDRLALGDGGAGAERPQQQQQPKTDGAGYDDLLDAAVRELDLDDALSASSADSDADGEHDNEDDDDQDTSYVSSSPAKLVALAQDLVQAQRLAGTVGAQSPLVKKIEERLATCRSTLLLDTNAAVKEVRRRLGTGKKDAGQGRAQARLLKLLAVYRIVDGEEEIVRILKER